MKNLDFFKYSAVLAAMILLFAAGCSDDKDDGSNRDGNIPDPGTDIVLSDNIIIPTEPPAISATDGELTKGGNGENLAVTRENLYDFVDVFMSTIYRNNYSSGGVRAQLPEEYERENSLGSGCYSIRDGYGGRIEITWKGEGNQKETKTNESEKEYQSTTYKHFDFSQSNELFLGGAVGRLEITVCDNFIRNDTEKVNGVINFQGKYKGKLVFDNIAQTTTYERKEFYDAEYGYRYYYYDSIESNITNGSFYVQSERQERIYLNDDYSLSNFISPSSPYQYDNTDYGDGQITIDKMPVVPSVPSGSLNNHSGKNRTVTEENVEEFFEAFTWEISNSYNESASPVRSATINEVKDKMEELRHGKVSGYFTQKAEMTGQRNNSGEYFSSRAKGEYHDYSNNGVLYLGGGSGAAVVSTPESDKYEVEGITNIKIKFNGEFKGEIVFDNFKFEYSFRNGDEYDAVALIGGSVKIGAYEVPQKYGEWFLNLLFFGS